MADSPPSAGDRAGWRPALLLGLALLVTYAYFVAPAAWNETSRFDLTRSLVERRRIDIDPFQRDTGDKSFYGGHYYSDKAPGTSFLAAIPYGLYLGYLRATGRPPPEFAALPPPANGRADQVLVNPSFRKALYVCNLFTNALVGAALGAVFFATLCGLGCAAGPALFATLALSLGSLVFPYATMLYGHVLAAGFLFGAFALLLHAKEVRRRGGGDVPGSSLACAGALSSAAVVTELPCGVAAAGILLYALHRLEDRRRIALFALGGLGPALLLGAYQAAAFGSPFRPGYASVSGPEFAAGMARGLMGIGAPKPEVLYQILFGRFRGLLYLSPVLLWGFLGVARLAASRERRAEGVLCGGICAYFLLMNSGYFMWSGGAALGPRHVIPMLPFLCLGIPDVPRRGRAVAILLLVVSIANQSVATAVAPEAPEQGDPLLDHAYFHFLHGRVAVQSGTTNLGLLIGLPGPLSLLPLGLLWLLTLRVLLPAARQRGGEPAHA